ncbi:MAG: tyrosine-type recombinase/integrase [Methermicoccaceae archaeon]
MRYYKPSLQKFQDVFNDWEKRVYYELPSGTRSEYKKPVVNYLSWLEEKGYEVFPYDPNPQIQKSVIHNRVQQYIDELAKDKSKSYVAVSFHAINTIYRYLFYMPLDSRLIKLKGREQTHKPVILEEDEIERLFKSEDDFTRATMIRTGYHCALRASELVTIKGADYNDGVLKVRVRKSRREKYKEVVLPDELRDRIEELIEEEGDGYIFKRDVEGELGIRRRRWLPGEWGKWFGDYSENALGKRVRWHDFARHTRLTLYAEEPNTTFKDVLLLSGHSNPAVALKYFERAKSKIEGVDLKSPFLTT